MAIDLLMNRERGESAVKVMYKKLQIQKAFFFFSGRFLVMVFVQQGEVWTEIHVSDI